MAAAGERPSFCRPQKDLGSDEPESACKQGFSLERPTIGPGRVRSQSDPTQTHKPTAHAKKGCKWAPFSKRLTGFEPSTFCMASSSSATEIAPKCRKSADITVSHLGWGSRELHRNAGGLLRMELGQPPQDHVFSRLGLRGAA